MIPSVELVTKIDVVTATWLSAKGSGDVVKSLCDSI